MELFLQQLELPFLYWIQTLHHPVLDEWMVRITCLGNGGWFWILVALILLCFKKTRPMGITMSISMAVGFLIGNVALKNLFARQRPCWVDSGVALLVARPSDFSFPSGHSMVSFEGAVSIWLYNRKGGSLALGLAALIACSRLYLFVHFPTDVLAGSILGALTAWMVYRMQKNRGTGSAGTFKFPLAK